LIACGSSQSATQTHAAPIAEATASAAAAPKSAPVVVALVIDQFAAWEAAERLDDLPKNGGFARLRHEGTTVRDMRFAHAVTETAAGHSALFTGSPPDRSGIVANELVDPKTRERVSAFLDPSAHVVTAQGALQAEGVGLPGLQVDTVADVLRKTRPHA